MRLIDKDKLMEKLTIKDKCDDCQYHKHNWFCDRPFEFEDICEAVRDAPVVEIIHCKDCKHWMRTYLDINGKHGCNVMREYTSPNDYCFKAEREA